MDKHLLFLMAFDVTVEDLRDRQEKSSNIILPFANEVPEDLEDAKDIIKQKYERLGYRVKRSEHIETKVTELEITKLYEQAKTADEYYGEEWGR